MNDYLEVKRLIKQLLDKPTGLINMALVELLLNDKIDFITVSNAYTTALNNIKEDSLNQLIEAETCVSLSCFSKIGGKRDADKTHTQRCLYLLNRSNRFQMRHLNEKYGYNEEEGKKASWYERNKIEDTY